MSMWDTDRAYGGHRLDEVFPTQGVSGPSTDPGAQSGAFILYDVHVLPEKVETSLPGGADKTLLKVAHVDHPAEVFVAGTLGSAIAEKASRATANDFPALVRLERIRPKNEAHNVGLVLTFVRMYSDAVGVDEAAEFSNNADQVEWSDQDKTPDWLAQSKANRAAARSDEPAF